MGDILPLKFGAKFQHLYSNYWKISVIWLAESSRISAKIEIPTCENYSHYGNKPKSNNLVAQVKKKMAQKFQDFKNQEIQELKENSENQNIKQVYWLGSMCGTAGQKTRTLKQICYPTQGEKLSNLNKQMALHDWISQVVIFNNDCNTVILLTPDNSFFLS